MSATPTTVILLHGLWMRGFTLGALRRRIEHAGYAVELFDYASVMHGPDASVQRLLRRIEYIQTDKLHFVGHSLGGLIALRALQQATNVPFGNVVCLGAPLRGSAAARAMAHLPGARLLIGKSADLLRIGLARWDGSRPVGVIAGRVPVGLGFIGGGLRTPHDGTVGVDETELPGITDHCLVSATHTGLLFSRQAARQTLAFLRDARFARANNP